MRVLKKEMVQVATRSREASRHLAQLTTKQKNKILNDMAKSLRQASTKLMRANAQDVTYARRKGHSEAMIDRLTLNKARIAHMAESIEAVAKLPDPIGRVLSKTTRPNGLKINKVSVPLGVILIIYEARPNVTTECASLCLKSGNAVILRGGSETFHSNKAIVETFEKVLKKHKIPTAAISRIATRDRAAVKVLVQLNNLIDLVIPRGGYGLIRTVTRLARIPIVKHDDGICHVYLDKEADFKMAIQIAVNAKCQRPSVCNAMETLLVHEKIAPKLLPCLKKEYDDCRTKLVGCAKTRKILKDIPLATEKDWKTEYLDYKLAIRVVKSIDEAIAHINKYGSSHTDSIVTKNKANAKRFLEMVDSSSVMWNASTRFSDGFEYGFGAEIGISTQKTHARGPMGLEGLTSYKYIVVGKGQVRR